MCKATFKALAILTLFAFFIASSASACQECKGGCGKKGGCSHECQSHCTKHCTKDCAKSSSGECKAGSEKGCKHDRQCGKSSDLTLDKMKSLAGVWQSAELGRDGKKERVVYKVISGGTALQEILFPGDAHEMVSIYHNDGGSVAMTHYCALGNQPVLRLSPEGEGSTHIFNFAGGSNINSENDRHIHQLKLTWLSNDHIKQEWTSYKDGKPEFVKTINFHRLKG
ncbi:MAG: hypothetical protein DCC75_02940 [Proteobacteria bacterium]|nr:MAG: hypothetical protein DCC75_02940 [Pseudomonadota bacterium]